MRAILLVVAAVACSSAPALAHYDGKSNPALRAWYHAQRDGFGQSCCDVADGHAFFGSYALEPDGSIEFDADGAHHVMHPYQVLTGPNPTGHAVWWHAGAADYCFAPGGGA